jgi:protein-S-isoprenylcysteine O-methyltransferase Ste14
MTNSGAAAGSAVFLAAAPGVVTGLVPWWITGWDAAGGPWWLLPLRIVGGLLVAAGVAALLHAFGRFVVEGRGTPAPVAPTAELVVGGLYKYLRNPMYVAVLMLIVGQSLLLARPVLLAYAAAVALAVVSFVKAYEEPTLRRQFGAAYVAYQAEVPGWWPRLSPRRARRV